MNVAAATREGLEDFVTSGENPEISAMAAICRILEDLPDDAARLRVMRWAFGKFGEEFKRAIVVPTTAPAPPHVVTQPPVLVASTTPAESTPPMQPADFERQVAELDDLFADRADGLKLARPRER